MAETDTLEHLLNSDPNAPATNAVVLLLRAETKSEFKALRTDFGRMGNCLDGVERHLARLTEDVVQLKQEFTYLRQDSVQAKQTLACVSDDMTWVKEKLQLLVDRK